MKFNISKTTFLILGTWILWSEGCVTRYSVPASVQTNHDLVVEGFLNTNGPTTIQLTRSQNLNEVGPPVPELGARVAIQDQSGNYYQLTEQGNGYYGLDTLQGVLDSLRLYIITSDGQQYVSDYTAPVLSSPIDSISWNLNNGGVQINASTHGISGQTSYYLWRYEETWEIKTYYNTLLEFIDTGNEVFNNSSSALVEQNLVFPLPPGVEIDSCWRSDSSQNILLGTSAGLSQNVVSDVPILYIQNHDPRISTMYSILVYQYALTSLAYQYWVNLKANSEQTGTIFDPTPFTESGNLHCMTNPSLQVLGFISAGTWVQQRIYISNKNMAADWNPLPDCPDIKVHHDSAGLVFPAEGLAPIDYIEDPTCPSCGIYDASYRGACVDCRALGSNIKPYFWP